MVKRQSYPQILVHCLFFPRINLQLHYYNKYTVTSLGDLVFLLTSIIAHILPLRICLCPKRRAQATALLIQITKSLFMPVFGK
jgi:hypothetical protein